MGHAWGRSLSETREARAAPLIAYRQLIDSVSAEIRGQGDLKRLGALLDEVPATLPDGQSFATDGMLLVIDPTGRVMSLNAAASSQLSLTIGENIGTIALADSAVPVLLKAVRASSGVGTLQVTASGGESVLLAGTSPETRGNIVLAECRFGQQPALAHLLAQTFGLSPVELRLMLALMEGKSVEAIAAASGRKLSTVRQSVKAVIAKMGVHSQTQAVALGYALAITSERLHERPAGVQMPLARLNVECVDGCEVPVHRFGRPGGYPVLLIHGALFGIVAQPEIRRAADTLGLDVLAPTRPGYGACELPEDGSVVDRAVRQMLAVLSRHGFERVVVVAHDIGTRFAAALAIAHPERVAGLVCAPVTPPMRSWSQTADMPLKHRVNAWASQRMPALMDRIVALGFAQVARKGVEIIPDLVFADCDFDRQMWQQPRFAPSLQEFFGLVGSQQARGFCQDMRLTNEDWSGLAGRIACPTLLIHGGRSQTVSANAAAELAERIPQGEFRLLPDAGHTLALSHGDLLLRQALLMAARAGLPEQALS